VNRIRVWFIVGTVVQLDPGDFRFRGRPESRKGWRCGGRVTECGTVQKLSDRQTEFRLLAHWPVARYWVTAGLRKLCYSKQKYSTLNLQAKSLWRTTVLWWEYHEQKRKLKTNALGRLHSWRTTVCCRCCVC